MQVNTGTLPLQGVAPTNITQAQLSSPMSCGTGVISTMLPGDAVQCTGSFTFSQDAFALGQKVFTPSFTTSTAGAVIIGGSTVATVLALPALNVAIDKASCRAPAAAGLLLAY